MTRDETIKAILERTRCPKSLLGDTIPGPVLDAWLASLDVYSSPGMRKVLEFYDAKEEEFAEAVPPMTRGEFGGAYALACRVNPNMTAQTFLKTPDGE